ncbi:MAG: CopD family protein [Azospirillaceae bacterium]|nr:CopD family protein [Azospirillaceae bacterium]
MMNSVVPVFDLAEGGLWLAFARGVTIAALFSLFGTLVFLRVVAPRCRPRMTDLEAMRAWRALRRLAGLSVAVAIAALLTWLVFQAGAIADAVTLRQALLATPLVLTATRFGHLVMVQAVLLAATAVLLSRSASRQPHALAVWTAGVAVILHAGHGHALSVATHPLLLPASMALHLLAGGAWLGGLVPLLLFVRMSPPQTGATVCRYFSPLGKLCLVAMLISVVFQGWVLIGNVPALIGTGYGWVALGKLALLGLLFGLAVLNRYHLAPALRAANARSAQVWLVRSIALQTGFSVAVILAAAVLASLPPGFQPPS